MKPSYYSLHLSFVRFIADVAFEMGKESLYLSKKFLNEVWRFFSTKGYWATIYDAPLFFHLLDDQEKMDVAKRLLGNYLNVIEMFQNPLDFFGVDAKKEKILIDELDALQVLYDGTEGFSKPIMEKISSLRRTDSYLNDLLKWKRSLI